MNYPLISEYIEAISSSDDNMENFERSESNIWSLHK